MEAIFEMFANHWKTAACGNVCKKMFVIFANVWKLVEATFYHFPNIEQKQLVEPCGTLWNACFICLPIIDNRQLVEAYGSYVPSCFANDWKKAACGTVWMPFFFCARN